MANRNPVEQWPELRAILINRRKALGWSQRTLAQNLGTAQSVISDLESGVTAHPNLDTLVRWASALHITLSVRLEMEPVFLKARTETVNLT